MSENSFAQFYQDELVALRKDARRFGKRHPEMADSLGLEWGDSPDPMMERVIESMAWFAARIRRDSQARMPLAARQILQRIHPHFTRPVPSVGIASLTPPETFADAHPAGKILPAGSRFHCADPDGAAVRWRTGWPVLLNGAQLIRRKIGGRSLDLTIRNIRDLPTLRLYPWGDPHTTHPLHQWVHSSAADVLVNGTRIGREALKPAGLSPEELVLPRPSFAHPAFQLLQEYFACPDRFLFWDVDLSRCEGAFRERNAETTISINLRLPPPESVRAELLRFDTCAVPLVNLHETLAEPILVDHTRHSYPLETDRRDPDTAEVHSILEMEAIRPGGRSAPIPANEWHERRSPRTGGNGTDVDLFFKSPAQADAREPFTVSARILCTDRGRATTVGNKIALENDDEMDIASATMERPPTRQYDPPLDGDELWYLVSAMTQRHDMLTGALSGEISDGGALSAIKETLRLFIPNGCRGACAQVDAITAWESKATLAPLRATRLLPMGGAMHGHVFTMRLDPAAFKTSSPYLFAKAVESFLALSAAPNTFTQLTAYSGDDELFQGPPRSGDRLL